MRPNPGPCQVFPARVPRGTLKGNIIHRILRILKTSNIVLMVVFVGIELQKGSAIAKEPLGEIRRFQASPNKPFGAALLLRL